MDKSKKSKSKKPSQAFIKTDFKKLGGQDQLHFIDSLMHYDITIDEYLKCFGQSENVSISGDSALSDEGVDDDDTVLEKPSQTLKRTSY